MFGFGTPQSTPSPSSAPFPLPSLSPQPHQTTSDPNPATLPLDEARSAHAQVYDSTPHAKFSHELISGAAAFEGMKLFEDHQRRQSSPDGGPSKPVSHAFAKELLAGFVGAEVDKLAETKGEEAWEDRGGGGRRREETKERAQRGAERMYDDHYGGEEGYDPGQSGRGAPDFGYEGRREGGERRREGRREEGRRDEERYDQGGYQEGGGYGGGAGAGGYQQDYQEGGYERRDEGRW